MFKHPILVLCGVLLGTAFQAKAFTIPELISAINAHHPQILAAQSAREQAELEQLKAQGEFDIRLEQKTHFRTSGYYHGKHLTQSITKPLHLAGAELIGKYRISDGNFPIYENYFNTQTGGEASLGVKFSLLKNHETDARRTQLANTQFLQRIGLSEEKQKQQKLIYQGIDAYLNWVESHAQVEILSELVSLAQTRRAGIETRVNSGDLATISLSEFETTLISRQIALNQAQQRLASAKIYLGYYWRDHSSTHAQSPIPQAPPSDIQWPFSVPVESSNFMTQWVDQHPKVKALNAKLLMAKNQSRLAKNQFLPKLDVELKLARDIGTGSQSLAGTESYVGLHFSVPLERRAAIAKKAQASAKIKELTYEKQAIEEQLALDFKAHIQQLFNLKKLNKLIRTQSEVSLLLAQQERHRFEEGDSNQFLLNAREMDAGHASLSTIASEMKLLREELKLLLVTGQIDTFF